MGRPVPRVTIAEAVGELPEFTISDEAWNLIEFRRDRKVGKGAELELRSRLDDICRTHMHFFQFEETAETVRDLKAAITYLRDEVRGFTTFASCRLTKHAHVSTHIEWLLQEAVALHPVDLRFGRIKSRRKRRTFLTLLNLREIGRGLEHMMLTVEATIADDEPHGFKKGAAIDGWLGAMRSTSKDYGVSISARSADKSPLPFSEFLYHRLAHASSTHDVRVDLDRRRSVDADTTGAQFRRRGASERISAFVAAKIVKPGKPFYP